MRAWVIVAVALVALPASAWTTATDESISKEATRLAPPDLRFVLDKFDEDFARGLADAESEESSRHRSDHFATDGGGLEQRLLSEIRSSIEIVRKRVGFHDFVYRLGIIAHLVGDANNPFHVADSDPRLRACQSDFERYVQSRIGTMRPVFYGIRKPTTIEGYVKATIRRTMEYYPQLSEEYFRGGQKRSSKDFDDKSSAFGVASLTYSHSISDLVNIYYYIWQQVGGNVQKKPVPRRPPLPTGGHR